MFSIPEAFSRCGWKTDGRLGKRLEVSAGPEYLCAAGLMERSGRGKESTVNWGGELPVTQGRAINLERVSVTVRGSSISSSGICICQFGRYKSGVERSGRNPEPQRASNGILTLLRPLLLPPIGQFTSLNQLLLFKSFSK